MGVWEFVLVYLVGFALLQLVVYQLLRRRRDRSAPIAGGAGATPFETSDREAAPEDEAGWRCPHCGTPNAPDPGFTYCRHCAGALRG